MKAAPGSIVGLYWDASARVVPGDRIHTKSGRRYEVQSVRVQMRGKHEGRQHMRVRVMHPEEPEDPDVGNFRIHWYTR